MIAMLKRTKSSISFFTVDFEFGGKIKLTHLTFCSKGQCRNKKNLPLPLGYQSRAKWVIFQRHLLPLLFL